MAGEFEGRVALVTGGASGIGEAVARQLAAWGANVVIADLHEGAAKSVADTVLADGGQAVAVAGDVGRPEDVRVMVAAAISTYGGLHLAVNNAGIGGPQGALGDYDDSDGFAAYHQLISVNLNSVFYGMRYEIPEMLRSGRGAIVNVSSILGLVGEPTAAPYTAAKHGIAGLTKAAAATYAAQGIRINSVHPGYIDTPLLQNLPREAYDALASKHPIGRLGTAAEVAELVTFLLSDRASFITGSQHLVDGGYTAV